MNDPVIDDIAKKIFTKTMDDIVDDTEMLERVLNERRLSIFMSISVTMIRQHTKILFSSLAVDPRSTKEIPQVILDALTKAVIDSAKEGYDFGLETKAEKKSLDK